MRRSRDGGKGEGGGGGEGEVGEEERFDSRNTGGGPRRWGLEQGPSRERPWRAWIRPARGRGGGPGPTGRGGRPGRGCGEEGFRRHLSSFAGWTRRDGFVFCEHGTVVRSQQCRYSLSLPLQILQSYMRGGSTTVPSRQMLRNKSIDLMICRPIRSCKGISRKFTESGTVARNLLYHNHHVVRPVRVPKGNHALEDQTLNLRRNLRALKTFNLGFKTKWSSKVNCSLAFHWKTRSWCLFRLQICDEVRSGTA